MCPAKRLVLLEMVQYEKLWFSQVIDFLFINWPQFEIQVYFYANHFSYFLKYTSLKKITLDCVFGA